ncbi:MAG: SoxR reducing system RseC family protein [Candidatus Aminicenantes bacterium]|jgi:positive regulator of sigma E activity
MKDKGRVIATQNGLAQVEVQCLIESCGNCSARSLCTGQEKATPRLDVQNPLNARVGDEVEIEIPETKYSQALILLFGSLLIALLLGMGGGYFLSFLLPLSTSAASILGLTLAVIISGAFLYRYFRRRLKNQLYPVITDIINKGGGYE